MTRWVWSGDRRRWGAWRTKWRARSTRVVAQAILDEFAGRYELYEGAISGETLRLAEGLEGEHLAP